MQDTTAEEGDCGWNTNSSPSEAVIEAIAEETKTPPEELPPLYDSIDPEALDRLFENRDSGTVSFCCCGYEITVEQTGEVAIQKNNSCHV